MPLTQSVRPLLANYATHRSGETAIPGHYCDKRMQWVIEAEGKVVPMIDAPGSLAELVTKTKVRQETDDDSAHAFLEITTKTEAQVESEDRKVTVNFL